MTWVSKKTWPLLLRASHPPDRGREVLGAASTKAGRPRIICQAEQRRLFITIGPDIQEQAHFAIGWGTLSLINSGLAQSKGRSGLLWWLLSLLLGPLATFLIVVLPAVENPRAVGYE